MHNDDERPAEPALVTNRAMEIVVALVLLAGSALVIYDSVRVGHGWQEGSGPAPGYFPFYIAVILALAAAANMLAAVATRSGTSGAFVSRRAFGSVLSVLLPTIGFVALIQFIGIYVAAALFIAVFMAIMGREPVWKSALVGGAIPFALFMMFERWFLVPLPKGPLEAVLGFG
jgi:putative tricarboxylic transport membrane protein